MLENGKENKSRIRERKNYSSIPLGILKRRNAVVFSEQSVNNPVV